MGRARKMKAAKISALITRLLEASDQMENLMGRQMGAALILDAGELFELNNLNQECTEKLAAVRLFATAYRSRTFPRASLKDAVVHAISRIKKKGAFTTRDIIKEIEKQGYAGSTKTLATQLSPIMKQLEKEIYIHNTLASKRGRTGLYRMCEAENLSPQLAVFNAENEKSTRRA